MRIFPTPAEDHLKARIALINPGQFVRIPGRIVVFRDVIDAPVDLLTMQGGVKRSAFQVVWFGFAAHKQVESWRKVDPFDQLVEINAKALHAFSKERIWVLP